MIDIHMRKKLGYIDGLKDFVNDLPYNINMIEIGCYAGESTKVFLDSGKINNLIAIDPYIDDYDMVDVHSRAYRMSDVFDVFNRDILSKYDNVRLIKSTSDDAVDLVPIGLPINLVYIDGCHQYENTLRDIKNYLPFIEKDGIISGHDFHYGWPGVIKAVDEMFGEPDKIYSDFTWMVKLKGRR